VDHGVAGRTIVLELQLIVVCNVCDAGRATIREVYLSNISSIVYYSCIAAIATVSKHHSSLVFDKGAASGAIVQKCYFTDVVGNKFSCTSIDNYACTAKY
jgi:hypothetical protein